MRKLYNNDNNMTYLMKMWGGGLLAVAMLFVGATGASAQQIDVDWNGDRNPTLSKTNMAPGQAVEHKIGVRNDTPEPMDVYINLDRASDAEFDNDFSKQFDFYVIDNSSGKYLVGGKGDRMNLKEAVEDGDTFIERLDAGEKNTYLVRARFDKDAGNEFQGRSTKFDITMQISGELTAGGAGGGAAPIPYRPGQQAGGNDTPEPEVLGAEDDNQNGDAGNGSTDANGNILGAADRQCQSLFPWWAWVLGVIGFAVLFNGARLLNIPRARHIFQIVAIVLAIGGWFFYDNCRDYWWSLIIAAIAAAISMFLAGQITSSGEES